MSKHSEFPAFKWHPETGESRIFNAAHEVPDGWLDSHPSNIAAAGEKTTITAPPKADKLPMSKKDIVKALAEGGIEHDASAPASVLYGILDEKLREHLASNKIDIPEGANVPALLALTAK